MHKFLVGTVLGFALALSPVAAGQAPDGPRWQTRPCKEEDSNNCYWNAQTQGDGMGHSFYAVRVGKKVCVLYWQTKYARNHNHCGRI